MLRRAGQNSYRANLYYISYYGCRVELLERPEIDERFWIGFDGLELIAATLCWTQGFEAGLEFEQPIHPAVFALLSRRYGAPG